MDHPLPPIFFVSSVEQLSALCPFVLQSVPDLSFKLQQRNIVGALLGIFDGFLCIWNLLGHVRCILCFLLFELVDLLVCKMSSHYTPTVIERQYRLTTDMRACVRVRQRNLKLITQFNCQCNANILEIFSCWTGCRTSQNLKARRTHVYNLHHTKPACPS